MKRFLCILAVMFFAAGLFAAPKLTEKQVEDFIEKGSYVKVVVFHDNVKSYVNYYRKENISVLFLSDDRLEINDDQYKFRDCEFSFEGNNIIITRYYKVSSYE